MKKFLMMISFLLLLSVCGNIVVLAQEQLSYNTREIRHNADYKLIEMYVRHNDRNFSRRITFELPVDWYIDNSSVVGLRNEENINNYSFYRPYYRLKLDMWNIISATRESTLNEFNIGETIKENYEIIDEKIYSTKDYEIIYYKLPGVDAAVSIHCYYLYANGERLAMTGYVFDEDKPEYDDIFMRIAESVTFQFDVNESISAPQTNDNIFICFIILLFISVILIKHCKKGAKYEI